MIPSLQGVMTSLSSHPFKPSGGNSLSLNPQHCNNALVNKSFPFKSSHFESIFVSTRSLTDTDLKLGLSLCLKTTKHLFYADAVTSHPPCWHVGYYGTWSLLSFNWKPGITYLFLNFFSNYLALLHLLQNFYLGEEVLRREKAMTHVHSTACFSHFYLLSSSQFTGRKRGGGSPLPLAFKL